MGFAEVTAIYFLAHNISFVEIHDVTYPWQTPVNSECRIEMTQNCQEVCKTKFYMGQPLKMSCFWQTGPKKFAAPGRPEKLFFFLFFLVWWIFLKLSWILQKVIFLLPIWFLLVHGCVFTANIYGNLNNILWREKALGKFFGAIYGNLNIILWSEKASGKIFGAIYVNLNIILWREKALWKMFGDIYGNLNIILWREKALGKMFGDIYVNLNIILCSF